MSDTYPRKGVITRAEAIAMLEADPVFYTLTTNQKNYALNYAVQRLAAFRNGLGKEDYLADNVSSSSVLIGALVSGTTAERLALGATLTASDAGFMFFDTDDDSAYWWNGTTWV